MRRPILAIVGSSGSVHPKLEAAAEAIGAQAIAAGFRLLCGGRDGIMEAACRGARGCPAWREGDVIGVLPGYDREAANPFVDVAIPTGLGLARNVVVVASADVVLAIAGGSGTLSELALAWQLGKPVIALDLGLGESGGWAERSAGLRLDARRDDAIARAGSVDEAIALARAAIER